MLARHICRMLHDLECKHSVVTLGHYFRGTTTSPPMSAPSRPHRRSPGPSQSTTITGEAFTNRRPSLGPARLTTTTTISSNSLSTTTITIAAVYARSNGELPMSDTLTNPCGFESSYYPGFVATLQRVREHWNEVCDFEWQVQRSS